MKPRRLNVEYRPLENLPKTENLHVIAAAVSSLFNLNSQVFGWKVLRESF
jgi:hypothetical protein